MGRLIEHQDIPGIWPWCVDADEWNNGNNKASRLIATARRKWPEFDANQHAIATVMQMDGAEFWVACRMVLEGGAGIHICPSCGYEFGDM